MARQTRAERRARRQQHAAEPAVAEAGGSGGAKPPVQLAPEPPARPEPHSEGGGGFRRFIGESWGELQKVEWPTQRHVVQGTVVVLVACVIVGTYLWLADIAAKHIVQVLIK